MEEGVSCAWCIVNVDNCTVHTMTDNKHLQEVLLMGHDKKGLLMTTLLPYNAEINPTELLFYALLMHLIAIRRESSKTIIFLEGVRKVL